MNPPDNKAWPESVVQRIEAVRSMVRACIQCGTCTASCPNEFAMDRTPRNLWRAVLVGDISDVLNSRTFALCSSCYTCSLRCPRGLPLPRAMAVLKQAAAELRLPKYRSSRLFYADFLQEVRRNGRTREMTFMALYFAHMADIRLPMRYAAMGAKLMAKGKVSLPWPNKTRRDLSALFDKVREIENETVSVLPRMLP